MAGDIVLWPESSFGRSQVEGLISPPTALASSIPKVRRARSWRRRQGFLETRWIETPSNHDAMPRQRLTGGTGTE
jgi:hypothetical protein